MTGPAGIDFTVKARSAESSTLGDFFIEPGWRISVNSGERGSSFAPAPLWPLMASCAVRPPVDGSDASFVPFRPKEVVFPAVLPVAAKPVGPALPPGDDDLTRDVCPMVSIATASGDPAFLDRAVEEPAARVEGKEDDPDDPAFAEDDAPAADDGAPAADDDAPAADDGASAVDDAAGEGPGWFGLAGY